jgi:hypothetical protein
LFPTVANSGDGETFEYRAGPISTADHDLPNGTTSTKEPFHEDASCMGGGVFRTVLAQSPHPGENRRFGIAVKGRDAHERFHKLNLIRGLHVVPAAHVLKAQIPRHL